MSIMGSTPWKSMVIVTLLLQLSLPTEVCSSATSDRITRLPGQPPVDFQQFAGYITVDRKGERALFYYFVEAKTEPSSKPLVIWFNGGPGCSSVGGGAFSENGPFRPNGNILVRNEYSWNTAANMLYVEMPVGVGFSYLRNMSQYKNRDLFITGESYAGHYIPQLAELLIRANKQQNEFNLKGIALGNPLLESYTNYNSRAEFLWSHGLISDPAYRVLSQNCNFSRFLSEVLRRNVSSICSRVMRIVDRETSSFVDEYDVTLDKCISPLQMHSLVLRPTQMTEKIDVCVLNKTEIYLNRPDVQTALHARLATGVPKWEKCSSVLKYNKLNMEISTINLLGSIVKFGIPVLVYSGDQDSNIPLTGTRTQIHGLAARLGLNTTVGGWTIVYGDMLSFATVRGASHLVPSTQPQRALVLFKAFLQGKPLPEHP
ncbi:putative serine carboxypeptidase [Nymphaea thermarum]|nr:putative serine carboxypeptidase [Nymphaea thermarum]